MQIQKLEIHPEAQAQLQEGCSMTVLAWHGMAWLSISQLHVCLI